MVTPVAAAAALAALSLRYASASTCRPVGRRGALVAFLRRAEAICAELEPKATTATKAAKTAKSAKRK